MVSALERGDDGGHDELSYNLLIIREHGQTEIKLFVFSPDNLPRRHNFAIFSRSSQSILELTSALERGDDAGHDELS